jgi:hypothetical protein
MLSAGQHCKAGTREAETRVAKWPTGWREATLRASGIPVSQFALDVLSGWQQSTPVDPWTNNPLGMPTGGNRVPSALNTPYAAFPTMQAFRDSFKRFTNSTAGKSLLHVMISAQSMPAAWREIHALHWPASITESEYPSVILDTVVKRYTDKVQARSAEPPTGTGTPKATPEVHQAVRLQSQALMSATAAFTDARKAIQHIVRSIG